MKQEPMKEKNLKVYEEAGFGFPVILLNVPMVRVRGEWTPNIDNNVLTKIVLHALCHKPARLIGNEIRFIRNHFMMTLQEFADRFCVTHTAVIKWEKTGNRSTSIYWATEKDIRLFVLSRINGKAKELTRLYAELERELPSKSVPIRLNAELFAA
jgi:hypothetical protein